jgi:hypothetical protein
MVLLGSVGFVAKGRLLEEYSNFDVHVGLEGLPRTQTCFLEPIYPSQSHVNVVLQLTS